MIDVAKRLIYLREQKGITTNKLANLAGISQSAVREIELGTSNPTVETLSYFCEALGISMSEFFNEGNNELNEFLVSSAKKLSESQQLKLADFINEMLLKAKKGQ